MLALCVYSYEVSLITRDEYFHVKLFPFSLIGDTLSCFVRLPHVILLRILDNSNQSFKVLIYIPKEVTFNDLMYIKQREGKYNKSFINYYIIMQIKCIWMMI